jgi:DNA replication and repair protein RecF
MIFSIELCGFRNLKEISLEFSRGITVASGQNGSGKSNLLEAIHIICQGFSFRTRNLQEAIKWDSDDFVIRAKTGLSGQENEAAIQVNNAGARVKLNGKESRRASALFGSAPLVFISPEDISLAKGSAENRRSFIDELLCFRKSGNLELLRRYRRVLQQRNRWLKDNLSGNAAGGMQLLEALTEQLASLAVLVWKERRELCEILEPNIRNYYQALSQNSETINFSYTRAMGKEEFLKLLCEKMKADTASGMTLSGPHRDDIELSMQGHSMRDFASQGQCRSIALAMKFAAAELIENHSGKPILLLDDIFAELDSRRREAVAQIVRQKGCQTFAATPNESDLPFKGDAVISPLF